MDQEINSEEIQDNELSLADIQAAGAALKKLSSKWASLLKEKMFPDLDAIIGRDRVYNIYYGTTRNPDARHLFILKALELKKELLERNTSAKDQLSELINDK